MEKLDLQRSAKELAALAERRGHVFTADLPQGITQEQIDSLERELQVRFPPSFQAFLRMHNGLDFAFYRPLEYANQQYPFQRHSLHVYSAAEIAICARDFIEHMDGLEIDDEEVRREAYCCVPFATFDPYAAIRIVFSTGVSDGSEGVPVLYVELETSEWMCALYGISDDALVANSVDELLSRAINHMLTTESGFWYWVPPPRWFPTFGSVTAKAAPAPATARVFRRTSSPPSRRIHRIKANCRSNRRRPADESRKVYIP